MTWLIETSLIFEYMSMLAFLAKTLQSRALCLLSIEKKLFDRFELSRNHIVYRALMVTVVQLGELRVNGGAQNGGT